MQRRSALVVGHEPLLSDAPIGQTMPATGEDHLARPRLPVDDAPHRETVTGLETIRVVFRDDLGRVSEHRGMAVSRVSANLQQCFEVLGIALP